MSLQSFVYATFLSKARDYGVEYRMSLQVDSVEIFIQAPLGEQGGVRSTTMLLYKVKSQIGVLAKRVICLFWESKIGVVKSVMFGISNLIFHCKYPFLKFVFVWHQLSRIFTSAVLGRDANNSKSASHITEHKKKSEPFAYRLWVRISTVWCG
jgi:hypothetical protein